MRESDLLPFYNRLAKLEGLMEAVHLSLQDSRREATRYLQRVDQLESRQLDIERRMVTFEQFQELSSKVSTLVINDTTRGENARLIQELSSKVATLEKGEAERIGGDKEKKNGVSTLQFYLTLSVAIAASIIALGQAVLPSLINQPAPQQTISPPHAKP
jgi:hypothetical protein